MLARSPGRSRLCWLKKAAAWTATTLAALSLPVRRAHAAQNSRTGRVGGLRPPATDLKKVVSSPVIGNASIAFKILFQPFQDAPSNQGWNSALLFIALMMLGGALMLPVVVVVVFLVMPRPPSHRHRRRRPRPSGDRECSVVVACLPRAWP